MIGKIISGSSFSGTVGYVMKEKSRILEAEGIVPPDAKRMAEDFNDQTLLNPRLKNTVGHISLSFSPKDAPRMTDALMTQIAKEYMQKMGITDTQYLLVRHLDQPHPHCGMPRADREVRAIPCAGKGRRAAGAAARTRQDQIRNLRCDQKVSAPMRRMERVGEATGKTGHRRPLQVLRKYRSQTRGSVLEKRFRIFRLEDRPGF